jgi:amino acid adenylation domain-containing protein
MLRQSGLKPNASAIPRCVDPASRPLSFAQQRLWFLDQLDPGRPTYNIRAALRLCGDLDEKAFSRAIQLIWARHETLRAVFRDHGGEPRQELLPEDYPLLKIIHRSNAGAACFEEAVEVANAETQLPFDLASGPLCRPALIRVGNRDRVLALTLHHIICDAWSIEIFFRELARFYNAFAEGREPEMPSLPIQYADFARWQLDRLGRAEARTQLERWKSTLNGVPPLEMPFDRPRPNYQTFSGGDYECCAGRELTDAIKRFGREHQVTDFALLMAGFQAALCRWSGQDDFAVGSTIAGRTHIETEPVIGLFMNVLPMRSCVAGDPSFSELVRRVHETTLEWHQNQEVPFDRLVEELRVPRDLSRHPVFQTLLTLHRASGGEICFAGIEVSTAPLRNSVSRLDLSVDVTQTDSEFHFRFEYDSSLFDAGTIERFANYFRNILEAGVLFPRELLSRLPLLSKAEQARLIQDLSDSTPHVWEGRSIHGLFEAQVALTPERVAAECGSGQITYRELDERANAIAASLADMGAGPGVLVGIAVSRGLPMLAALLGTLKSGAAYIPLDPEFPAARLDFMIADSGMAILISESDVVHRIPEFSGNLLLLDKSRPMAGSHYPGAVSGDDPAYVIYTSGSTGRPKGVAIAHSAVTNLLFSMSQRPGLTEADCLLATTTLSFDIAVLELYLPLACGARVVIAPRESSIDPVLLAKEIDRSGATVLQATPATWRMLIDSDVRWNPSLKALCGGEALSRELADELLARCSCLWNMYGPTETTVWSMVAEVQPDGSPIGLGSPIANTEIHILDRNLNPAPPGVAGELYIGGAGLAREYLNRPELTAEKFIPHPFTSEPGARLYRSGDLARRRSDGNIEFLGRADDQVKIRGHRIEPGEIESALKTHHAVMNAIVGMRDHPTGEQRLVAWVVPGGERPSISELRTHLAALLPDYMLPSAFVLVAEFPLTPNGKVDRRSLPSPAMLEPCSGDYSAPENSIEQEIATIWKEILGLDRVGRNENFFELGGHSLLLARVCARIRGELRAEITMTELFRYPTVSSLAGRLSGGLELAAAASARGQSRAGARLQSLRRQAADREDIQ